MIIRLLIWTDSEERLVFNWDGLTHEQYAVAVDEDEVGFATKDGKELFYATTNS